MNTGDRSEGCCQVVCMVHRKLKTAIMFKRITDIIGGLAILHAVLLSAASCLQEDIVETLTRDTDKISLSYSEGSTATFTVRTNGHWTVSSDASWLTMSPAEGTGNGKDYQTITVTAAGNTSAARSATIILQDAKNSLEITATQASGQFVLGTPSLGGSARLNSPSNLTVDVAYSKAQGTEEVKIEGVLTGIASEGLLFETYSGKPSAGNGVVSAPIGGIPVAMGPFELEVKVWYDNEIVGEAALSGTVLDENTILYLPGSSFPWGGYYVEGKGGVRSVLGESPAASVDDELTTCTSTQPGTTDLFRSDMTDFMLARGLKGYAGSKVYEHGEALKVGTGSVGGYFTTPALDALAENTDLLVEFDFARWAGDTKEITVSAVDGGTVENGILSTVEKAWIHYSLIVRDATPSTRIHWSASDLANPGSRFFISNVEISIFEELKEPLAPPEGLACKEYETSLEFSWTPAPFASAYDISLALAGTPDFVNIQRVYDSKATFTGLSMDTEYVARVRAVYENNEAFNSDYSAPCPAKTLFKLPQLAAPSVSIYRSERAFAVVQFESGASADEESSRVFSLELRDASGNVLRSYPSGDYGAANGVDWNRFTLANLKPSTKYQIAVMQHSSDVSVYADSDWAVYEYISGPDANMDDYVFYEDFNNMWIGGDLVNLSFAPGTATTGTTYKLADFKDEATCMEQCSKVAVPTGNCNNPWDLSAYSAYMDTYWLKWNYGEKFTDETFTYEKSIQYKQYPCAGSLKLGTGSLNGYLVLPELRSLTEPTDVMVSFDVVPYALPTAEAGELVAISDGATCSVALHSGSGGSIDGATDGVLAFTNKSPKEMGGWQVQTHTFTITGATSSTRIVIASGPDGETKGSKNRMWLDKVTVVKK